MGVSFWRSSGRSSLIDVTRRAPSRLPSRSRTRSVASLPGLSERTPPDLLFASTGIEARDCRSRHTDRLRRSRFRARCQRRGVVGDERVEHDRHPTAGSNRRATLAAVHARARSHPRPRIPRSNYRPWLRLPTRSRSKARGGAPRRRVLEALGAQRGPYTAEPQHKRDRGTEAFSIPRFSRCAGAQRGLYTAISFAFELRLVA